MSEWSQKMANKLRKREESQQVSDAKFVEMQKMKREIGPRLWQAVKSDVLAEGKALNLEYGKEVVTIETTPANELILRAKVEDSSRRLHVGFDSESAQITWNGPSGMDEKFEFAIGTDHKPAFYSGMVPYSTGSIARQILETLLD
ncbi:MAG: hypothetical protein WBE13_09795 [Candidatus Acidiferrum sp.]